MRDDSPEPRERAEADALARALEGASTEGAPADVMEVVALLRYARGEDQASQEGLNRARDTASRDHFAQLRRRRRRVTWAAMGTLATAAAVALIFVPAIMRSPAPTAFEASAPARPGPSALQQVLAAQALTLEQRGLRLDGLEQATARHRAELFARLEDRYGSAP